MTEVLKGLANVNLQWQESDTVQPLGPYKKVPTSEAGFSRMVISIVDSKGTARAILAPNRICQTFKPLDSALRTPRALWEFQGFRVNYGCKVPGFKYGEYEDHY